MNIKERTVIRQNKLSHERLIELLDYNPKTGIFINKINRGGRARLGDESGYMGTNGYIRISLDKTFYFAHRLAWFYVHKKWPKDEIDHKNRIKNDNRIINIRDATSSMNSLNKAHKAIKRSGIKGIAWDNKHKRWMVRHNNKHLCYTDSVEEGIKFQKEKELGIFVKPPKKNIL